MTMTTMANSASHLLEELTNALTEFFNPGTSNERKKAIGEQLEKFQENPTCPIFAVEFLGQTRDQNVLMFMLHCLQNLVSKKWPLVDLELKSKLKTILLDLIPVWNQTLPQFLTAKLLKVISEIARFDWPEAYPEFSLRLSQWLMEGKNHFKVKFREENLALTAGLRLVRTVVEEFCLGPCAYLTEQQKRKQCQQLKEHLIPGILDLIQEILTVTVNYLIVVPPGDAVVLENCADPISNFALFSEIASRTTIRHGRFQLDEVVPRSLITECLLCVSNVLEHSLTNSARFLLGSNTSSANQRSILSAIFTLAQFGTNQRKCGGLGASQSAAALALQCLIEITLNKPSDFKMESLGFLSAENSLKAFENRADPNEILTWHLFFMTKSLVKEVSQISAENLENMDDGYLKKLIELERAFIHNRLEFTEVFLTNSATFRSTNSDLAEIVEYLNDFCSLSENCLLEPELFLCCVEFWKVFCDNLAKKFDAQHERATANAEQNRIGRYQGLLERLTGILLRIFACGEHIGLSESAGWRNFEDLPKEAIFIQDQTSDSYLDEDAEQVDVETWQGFLKPCTEIVARLAELDLTHVFGQFYHAFMLRVEAFFTLEDSLHEAIRNETNERRLLWLMGDLQNLMMALARLNCFFINEQFEKNKSNARDLVELLCRAVVFCGRMKFHEEKALNKELKEYFANLFSGFLLCLRSYCHWVAQFYADAQRTGENNQAVSAIITASLDTVIPQLLQIVSGPRDTAICISRASVSLLYSILTTVRPQSYALSMSSVGKLYETVWTRVDDLTHRLPPKTHRILLACLGSYLVIPWHQAVDCEQEWSTRKKMYQKLIGATFEKLKWALEKDEKNVDFQEWQKILEWSAPMLTDMLCAVENEGSKTKQLVHSNLAPIAAGTLKWMGILAGNLNSSNQRILELLLQMLNGLFATLSVQLGEVFAKETVEKLLVLTETGSNEQTGLESLELSGKAMEFLLGILRVIVNQMSRAFTTFTESIVVLALQNLYPRIRGGNLSESIDAKQAFYQLVFSILDARWRHFFPSSIGGAHSKKENLPPWLEPQPVPEANRDKLLTERGEQLSAVLEIFGRSLQEESEPQIVKENLKYLNLLNGKWGLFKKPIFQTGLLPAFLQALFALYVVEKHSLLTEDISETVFNMVTSSESASMLFCQEFLPKFLIGQPPEGAGLREEQVETVIAGFKMEMDCHSFCANLNKVVCEIRLFQLCNLC